MEEPLEVLEESDCEINSLFLKCQPRSLNSTRSSVVTDLNLNRIRGSDDNDNDRISCFPTPQPIREEEVTSYSSSISRMSVDTGSATSSASGLHSDASVSSSSSNSVNRDGSGEGHAASSYLECEEPRSSLLDSSYEEAHVLQSASANPLRHEHYRLRDSRIEAAGGREIYCQSRLRPSRKRHSDPRRLHGSQPFYYHNSHMSSHSSPQVNQPAGRRPQLNLSELQKETSSCRSDTTTASPESSFEEGLCESSVPIEEISAAKVESPLIYETQLAGSSEVVFDDIGEWVTRGLHVKGYSGDSREKSLTGCDSLSHSHSEQDSETEEDHSLERVKKIGNVPIAEYEGSPRRYGMRTSTRHHSPRSLYLLPPIHRLPRPGFPRRVSSNDEKKLKEVKALSVREKFHSQKRDKNSIKTLTSRIKKTGSKGKSRTNIRERRSEISFKNKEIPSETEAAISSFNRAGRLAELNNRRSSFLSEEMYKKSGREHSNFNSNSISYEEVEEKLNETPTISISTLASVYSARDDKNIPKGGDSVELTSELDLAGITNSLALKYCDYEESETHKVLEEFFRGSGSHLSKQDFLDLEYTLKRHQGNSYVGQRLASEVDPDEVQDLEFSKEKIDLINQLPCALSTTTDMFIDDQTNMEAEYEDNDEEVSHASCFNHMQQLTNIGDQQKLTENTSSASSLSCLEAPSSKSSSDLLDVNIFKTDTHFSPKISSFTLEKGYSEHAECVGSQVKKDELELSDANKQIPARLEEIADPYSYSNNHIVSQTQVLIKENIDIVNDKEEYVDNVQRKELINNKSALFRENNKLCTLDSVDRTVESVTARETHCYSDAQMAAQMETSRNLTLSPTTTCDSVEAESDFSGGELEDSVHSSLKGVCPTMPILEDGLSSGEESDSGVMISQSKLTPECELTNRIIEQLPNEIIDCNGKNIIEINRQFDKKTNIDIHRRDMASKTRSFDDHLCRGEVPLVNNRFVSNSVRYIPPKSHSMEASESSGNISNSHHGFSFNISPCDVALKNSTPYGNSEPSPSSSTLSLMKKQITEIEREIALKKPDCLSRRFDQDSIQSSLDIHILDPLCEKICEPPPPPAPHPHRGSNGFEENGNGVSLSGCTTPGYSSGVLHSPQITQATIPGPQLLSVKGSVGSPVQAPHILHGYSVPQDVHLKSVRNSSPSRESVEAAIADIKQAIRQTKNVSLKNHPQERQDPDNGPVWVPRSRREFCDKSVTSSPNQLPHENEQNSPSRESVRSRERSEDDGDTDQETDRLLGRQRSRDPEYISDKSWRKSNCSRGSLQNYLAPNLKEIESEDGTGPNSSGSTTSTPVMQSHTHTIENNEPPVTDETPDINKKEKEKNKKRGKSKEVMVHEPAVLIEGVLFRARYLGSTQLVSEGQPTKTTRMMQAEEAVSRIKEDEVVEDCPLLVDPAMNYWSSDLSTAPQTLLDNPDLEMHKSFPIFGECNMTDGENLQMIENIIPTDEQTTVSPEVDQLQNTSEFKQNCDAILSLARNCISVNDFLESNYMDNDSYKEVKENDLSKCYDSLSINDECMEQNDFIEEVSHDDRNSENEMNNDKFLKTSFCLRRTKSHGSLYDHFDAYSFGTNRNRFSSIQNDFDPYMREEDMLKSTEFGFTSIQPKELMPLVSKSGITQGNTAWISDSGGALGATGTVFHLKFVCSMEVAEELNGTKKSKKPRKEMVKEAVARLKALAPEGEPQPSTEVDLFISTEKIMVLNTDLKEIMMDHALRTISYIADIGDLVVLMARRRVLPSDEQTGEGGSKTPKMICHVFESDEAQFIAQSIGQAFQVAYLEFLKANGIEDHSFVKEMDYQEVLNSQEIFGDELQMFAKKELQKEVVVPKMKGDILGVVVVESGWGSMVPTVVIANLSPMGAAAKCGQLNIGDQIIAINGVSLVGLPLSTCQNYIKNTKYNTAVKLTVVPCPPVVEVKIRRPDTKYQLGFSVQNGVICSLLRGGIAERGGVRVGHRIIDINSQSVVAVPHEKIVNLLATSVGEIRMKTMPTSIFRLLTGQETPQYI